MNAQINFDSKYIFKVLKYVLILIIGGLIGYYSGSTIFERTIPNISTIDSTAIDSLNQKVIILNNQIEHYKNLPTTFISVDRIITLPGTTTTVIVKDTINVYPMFDSTFTDTLNYNNLITSDNDTLSFKIFYYNNIKTYLTMDGSEIIILQNPSHQLKDLNIRKNNVYNKIENKVDLFNIYLGAIVEYSTKNNINPMIGTNILFKEKHMIGCYIGGNKNIAVTYGVKLF